MKTKKHSGSSSAGSFSRGEKVTAKKSGMRRHMKKSTSRRSALGGKKGGFISNLEELTPL